MSVIPAKLSVKQIDRATFDFTVDFWTDDAFSVAMDLSGKTIAAELWDQDRRSLKGTFDISVGSTANQRYFRLQSTVSPSVLKDTLWLDVLFVEPDASPQGFRRDYYLQVAVAFKKGYTT